MAEHATIEAAVLGSYHCPKIEGEIGVFHGIFLTGGKINGSSETGYPAIKRLMEVEEGNFNYYDYSEHGLADLDQSLKLCITQMINLMPKQLRSIDEKTMNLRALIFWGIFL